MEKDNIIKCLINSPSILKDLIESIPKNRYYKSFNKGIWSIYENINHLVITQIMLLKRIQLFIKEDKPKIIPFVPDENKKKGKINPKPIEELLKAFSLWRDKQIQQIKSVDDSMWEKKALHPEYSQYAFSILIRHILLHDYFHFHRIEELGFLKEENIKII